MQSLERLSTEFGRWVLLVGVNLVLWTCVTMGLAIEKTVTACTNQLERLGSSVEDDHPVFTVTAVVGGIIGALSLAWLVFSYLYAIYQLVF